MLFTLNIVTPTSTRMAIVSFIELQTDYGLLVIQKGHRPTIVTLKQPGEIKFQTEAGIQEIIGVSGGIVEVTRSSVMIVVG